MDVIVNTYGTRIRSTGERIVLSLPKKKEKIEYPVRMIEKILIIKPSSISFGAVKLAIKHKVDISFLDPFGMTIGRIISSTPKGSALLRKNQANMAVSEDGFKLVKVLVEGKTKNQIDYLKYLASKYEIDLSEEIHQAFNQHSGINLVKRFPQGIEKLLGIEGYIAARYFSGLQKIYTFPGRKPKNRDIFNTTLNYGYGILYNEIEKACLYAGLDPNMGFYHSERYGKPSLVLDLIEEFRVPLIDYSLFPLFVDGQMIKSVDYIKTGINEFMLSEKGKKKILKVIYERLNKKLKWDNKMYVVKDIISYQVNRLVRYINGESHDYKPFKLKKYE